MMMHLKFSIVFMLGICTLNTMAGKILFISVDPTMDRTNVYLPILKELLSRGNEITAFVSEALYLESENYREIVVDRGPMKQDPGNFFARSSNECHVSKRSLTCIVYYMRDLLEIWSYGREISRAALNSSEVQNFISENSDQFHLVISDFFSIEAFYIFAHICDAPLVLITSNDDTNPLYHAMGAFSIWSKIDILQGLYRDDCFIKRFINRFAIFYLTRIRDFFHIRKSDEIVREFFGDYSTLPSVGKIEKSASLVLYNNFDILNRPKPTVPGIIDIGGINVFPVKPLPNKLEKFIDHAIHGVIYMNLGPISNNFFLPREKMNIFIKTFSKSEMRILWKFDNKKVNLPYNVISRKTLPQNSILSHPNVKLFITHGGALSLQEGVLHGKPMIVIPSGADQIVNAMKVEQANIGMSISMDEITPEYLSRCIQDVIANTTYQENLQKYIDVFNYSTFNPVYEAAYWIEHVMVYRNSEFVRPLNLKVYWFEFLFLDSFVVAMIHIFIILLICKHIYRYFMDENENENRIQITKSRAQLARKKKK